MHHFHSKFILIFIFTIIISCNFYSPVSDPKVLSSADNSYNIMKWFNENEINIFYFKEEFGLKTAKFLDTVTVGTCADSIHALVPLYDFFSRLPAEIVSAYKYHSIYIGEITSSAAGVAFIGTGKIAIDNNVNLKWTYKTIAHEFGHIIHYWILGYHYKIPINDTLSIVTALSSDTCHYRQLLRGKRYQAEDLFRYPLNDSIINNVDYISEYSKKNYHENFAEHFDAFCTGAIDTVDINRSELLKSKIQFIKNKVFNGKQPPTMPTYY